MNYIFDHEANNVSRISFSKFSVMKLIKSMSSLSLTDVNFPPSYYNDENEIKNIQQKRIGIILRKLWSGCENRRRV